MNKIDKSIDLKCQVCPYTMVKSKLAMETLKKGQILEIILDHKPAVINVTDSLKELGHQLLEIKEDGNSWKLYFKKK